VHRLNTHDGVRFIESILRLIRSIEPDPEQAARQFRLMGYYLVGACLDETAGYARGPSAAEPVSDAEIIRDCPLLAESSAYFRETQWDATFRLGVDLLIEALENRRGRATKTAGETRRAGSARARRAAP
jgi:hypothetical protein